MSAFTITVRNQAGTFIYQAIAHSSCDAISDAIDLFGLAMISAFPVGGRHGQV